MQRQEDNSSTFRFLWNMFTCSPPKKPLSEEEQLLLNPMELTFSEQDTSSDETPPVDNSFGNLDSVQVLDTNDHDQDQPSPVEPGSVEPSQGPHISVELDDGFYAEVYAEVYDEFSKCDNVACCFCLLPIGLCGCAGLALGCTPVTLLPAATVAAFTPVQQAVMVIALPFGGMFTGWGAGALCWGKSTEAAEGWTRRRTEQNKSPSVCAFFTSCCEPAEEKPERPAASFSMKRE